MYRLATIRFPIYIVAFILDKPTKLAVILE
ncbi:hypothetical protein LCGC14_2723810, partial [marine sediment metagenome]